MWQHTAGSGIVTVLTPHVILSLPVPVSAPDGLVASSESGNSLKVVWNPLGCSLQNGPITGYIIDYNDTRVNVPGGSQTEYTVTNLAPNTLYSVKVAAVNDAGSSKFSDPVYVCTSKYLCIAICAPFVQWEAVVSHFLYKFVGDTY